MKLTEKTTGTLTLEFECTLEELRALHDALEISGRKTRSEKDLIQEFRGLLALVDPDRSP